MKRSPRRIVPEAVVAAVGRSLAAVVEAGDAGAMIIRDTRGSRANHAGKFVIGGSCRVRGSAGRRRERSKTKLLEPGGIVNAKRTIHIY